MPAVTVQFSQGSYTVVEGATLSVTVTLSADPERTVVVPITAVNQGTASDADYSGVPSSVTFDAGEMSMSFTFSATQDTDNDDDESVQLGFGSLPDTRVSAGTPAATTINITDDDVPAVTVQFSQGSYTVVEGATLSVTVTLSADPERTVVVPITAVNQGTASDVDYSGVPSSVTFDAGEMSKSFIFSATQDTVDDDDESVQLGFGSLPDTRVSAGSPAATTINITDDDVPAVTVQFSQGSYTVVEGATLSVTVTLSADPERTVVVPITAVNQGTTSDADYSGVPSSVTFDAGEMSKSFTFSATQDTDNDDDESVQLGFGSLPDTRVSAGTPAATTINITDDDVPAVTVQFSQGSYTVVEGATLSVTVTLSADPERTVVVPITAVNQGTTSDADYSGVPSSVTFDAGEMSKSFTFSATQDTVDDDDESVQLGFGSLPDTRVSAGTPAATTINITDDDVPAVTVQFSQGSYTVAEGATLSVTVTLSADPERTVVVPIAAVNQGTTSDADYSGVPSSVTFDAGEMSKSFTFSATQDTDNDDDESVQLGFGSLPDTRVSAGTPDTTTINITDDDVPAVTVQFSQGSYTVVEGATQSVTVTLNADPERTVVVPITAVNQGTTSDADYSGVPSSVTFDAGEMSKSFTFSATQDTDNDDDESVQLGFGSLPDTRVSAGAPAATTINITDDDVPAVTVQFSQGSYTVAEGATLSVTVTLSADPERTVVVPIAAVNQGTASDADYSGVPSSVTFDAGEMSKSFIFSATQDTVDDDDESVQLGFGSLPDAALSAGSPAATTINITDDDVPAVTVQFSQGSYTVAEGATLSVTVTLSADPERTVVVPITAVNQGTTSDVDYSGVPSSVTFDAGEMSMSFIFSATQDTVDDDDESVQLGFGSLPDTRVSAGSPAATTINITDDDVPAVTVQFSQGSYTVAEGATQSVTVTLSADPERTVVVPITAVNQGTASDADYSGVPSSVTFDAGEMSKSFTFSATQDTVDDDDESVQLGFGSLPDAALSAGAPAATTINITDDDVPAVTVQFSQGSYTVVEGATLSVTVTLSADPERTVVVPITAVNQGTASDADYSGVPSSVTFDAGEMSMSFTFSATQDTDNDDDESVQLGFGSLPDTRVSAGTPAATTINITDDDVPAVTVQFSQGSYTVVEGATQSVTVTLSADPERTVVVPITAVNQGTASDADYSGVPSSVTFDAGEMSKSFTFSATQDTVDDDDESVQLGFGSLPDAALSAGAPAATTINITDDDVPAVTVQFSQGSYTVVEGATLSVTVTLSADPERTVVVPITAVNQGTTSDADYSGVPSSVTFDAGEMSKSFTFSATQDTDNDDDESVQLGFGSLPDTRVSAGTPAATTINITDDDVPAVTVQFSQGSYTVVEGATLSVTVTLSADPERTVVVPITAVNQGTASDVDYSGVPSSVTFDAGEMSKSFTFSATQDTVDDDDESVQLGFGSLPDTRVSAGTPAATTINITDDDVPAVTVQFSQGSYTVAEGATLSVTVTLSADPERTVVVPITAVNQGTTSDADYSGVPSSVTFDAGEMSKSFTFSATQDTDNDDDESVQLGFGSLPDTRVSAGTPAATTINITDDDVPAVTVQFSQGSYTVVEGATLSVTVTLSADPERTVVVPITAVNQGTTSDADYSGVPSSVTFDAGEMSKSFTFSATQDTVDDDDESVQLGFGSLPDTRVSAGTPAATTINITDDDVPAVTVQFSQGSYTVAEGATLSVTVTLSADPERTVVVPIAAVNQGTASDADYSGVPSSVTFDAGEMSKSFTFSATQDTVDDDDESVQLGFGSLPDAALSAGTPDTTTINITDDDVPAVTVQFSQGSYTVAEGATLSVTVTLSADPERTVVVPITAVNQGTTSDVDYSGVPSSVTFDAGEMSKSFTFSATQDTDNDDDESVQLGFGSLPDAALSAGTPAATTINITDDDVDMTNQPPVFADLALAPPVNVQASATDERVMLTWQGNPSNFHVDGYRIERYEGHSSGWETLEPLWLAASEFPWDTPNIIETYLDTDVLPSAPYRYRIWSVNDRGIRSLYAAGVNVETAVDPPELRIFADHGRVTIGWDPPDDGSVTGYRILRRVQWEDEETPVGVTGRGVTSWVDRQVSPDTAYAYRLQALHDGRPGARSRYLFALTPRVATPTVVVSEPDGQDLVAGTETIGQIEVGGSVTGIIDSLDDRDWFAVEMEAGEAYHARLSYMTEDGLRSFANGRVVLGCLMDADGSDSPDTCLYKGRVKFEVQQRGTYYIVVQPRWYRADLGHPEMPTEYELELDHGVDLPQDSSLAPPYSALRTSSEVEVGTWVSGDLHNGDRADNHRVQLREGHWYRVPVFFDYGPEADGVLANAGAVQIRTAQGSSRWSDTSPHLFRASQTGIHYVNVARATDISTIYATRNTYYFREATYKFLVEDLGTLKVEGASTSQGQAANSPATGWPGITGTVRGGETLMATTDRIADEDGLTNADFAYQWVRRDLATNAEADIEGATSSTYTVTDADEGKAIMVRVTFTDDAGNDESLTSNALVSAPPLVIPDEEETPETPLTAAIHDAPESHNGTTDFTFELRFSEEPKEGFSYKTLRDHAFTVTGGEVAGARRLDGDSDTPNIRWEITVSPDSGGDVTITLPVTEDCDAEGAICANGDKKLSNRLERTVSGPGG